MKSLYRKLLEVGILAGGLVFICYFTKDRRKKKRSRIVRENMLLILRHLCLEIYKVMNENSKTTKGVYDLLRMNPDAMIDFSQLEEIMLRNGCKKQIEEAEIEVLAKFDLTKKEFYEELKFYEKDEEIQKTLHSMKLMYQDSLKGIEPKLPLIDEKVTPEVLIEILNKVFKEKRKVYKQEIKTILKNNENVNLDSFPNRKFFEQLQSTTEQVEEQVVKENSHLVPDLFTYRYLMNYYSNDDKFLDKKKYLETKHGEKMIKILKIKKNKMMKKNSKASSNQNSLGSTPSVNSLTDQQNSDKGFAERVPNLEKENKQEGSELKGENTSQEQIEESATLNEINQSKETIENITIREINGVESNEIVGEKEFPLEKENTIEEEKNSIEEEKISIEEEKNSIEEEKISIEEEKNSIEEEKNSIEDNTIVEPGKETSFYKNMDVENDLQNYKSVDPVENENWSEEIAEPLEEPLDENDFKARDEEEQEGQKYERFEVNEEGAIAVMEDNEGEEENFHDGSDEFLDVPSRGAEEEHDINAIKENIDNKDSKSHYKKNFIKQNIEKIPKKKKKKRGGGGLIK